MPAKYAVLAVGKFVAKVLDPVPTVKLLVLNML
jgi:hypothetical protein